MAPSRDRPQSDPSRIDVALEIVGEQGQSAVSDLTAQISTLNEYLSRAPGLMSPEGLAGGHGWSGPASQMLPGPGNTRNPGPATSHARNMPTPDDHAGRNASLPPGEQDLLREGNLTLWRRLKANKTLRPGSIIEHELDVYGAREREQARARGGLGRGSFDQPGLNFGNEFDREIGGGGSPSSSASMPPSMLPGESRARYNLRSNPSDWARGEESAVIPQFGEMTIQDKLKIGAGFLQRSGERAWQSQMAQMPVDRGMSAEDAYNAYYENVGGLEDAGRRRYMASGLMRQAGEFSGKLYPVVNDLRRVGGQLGQTRALGISAGYGTDGTISVGPFGMYNPFSHAMREGIHQRWTSFRLRQKGGINGEQADAIVGGLAANGFVGDENQDLAFDAVAPLVQEGLNPELTANQFSEAIRNNGTSMKDFRDTLRDLGPAARAARMSLDQYQESLGAFANEMQSMGATYGMGYSLGKNMSAGMNMTPQQLSPLMQSPLVQGMAMRQGLLPQQMGLQGAGQAAGNIYDAVNFAWQATAGWQGEEKRDPATGKVISADMQRAALAAPMVGANSPDEFLKLLKTQRRGTAAATALEAADAYQAKRNAYKKEIDPGKTLPKDLVEVDKDTPGAEKIGDKWFLNHNTIPTREKRRLIDSTMADEGASWKTTDARLHDLVNTATSPKERADMVKRVKEIEAMDPEKRAKEARRFADKYARQALDKSNDGPTVYVKFKGPAAKIFEQDKSGDANRKADAGAASRNENAASYTYTDSGVKALQEALNNGNLK